MSDNFSLAHIEYLAHIDPDIKGLIERKTATNNESFVLQLYKDIDQAIMALEQDRHFYQKVEFQEDHITAIIITFLKGRFYDAEHDTQHGGHCDILVKHASLKFEWIGEAKLWKGAKYIQGGFKQLTKRYATGTVNDSHGGILVYIKQPDAKNKLDTWETWIDDNIDTISKENESNPLRFKTIHKHHASGLPYNVRHMFVVLNHENTIEPEYTEDGKPI